MHGILRRSLPAFVPKLQDRTQHHVHFAVGKGVHLLRAEQEVHEATVHGKGLSPRRLVQGAEGRHAAVFVVDVKELVVFQQDMRNFGRTVVKPFCRISCIVIYIGDGIEVGVIGLPFRFHALRRGSFLRSRLRALRTAGAENGQSKQQQKGNKLSESPQSIHPLWFFRGLTEGQCPSVSLRFWIRRERSRQPWR